MNTKTPEYKLSQILRKRSEHLFAEGKQLHELDRARCRGLHKLDRQLTLTASVQNLKRLVSYMKRKKRNASIVSGKQVYNQISTLFNSFVHSMVYITEIIHENSRKPTIWVNKLISSSVSFSPGF